MTENTESVYSEKLILNLVITIRHISIYPAKHPIVINSIKNVMGFLNNLLNVYPAVSINVSPDNKIMVNSEPMVDKTSGDIQGFIPFFQKLGVEDLIFNPGISDAEIAEFVKIALLDASEIKKTADINDLFAGKGITHIKAKQFSYIKVEKGMEGAVVAGQPQDENGRKAKLKDYFDRKITDAAEAAEVEKSIFETAAFELKEKKKVGAQAKNLLKKFLTHAAGQADASTRLKLALIDLGCPAEDVEQLLAKISEEIVRGPVVRRRLADTDAGKLSAENEALRSELDRLKNSFAQAADKLENLEKKNKRIHDEKQRIDNIVHNMAEGMVVVDSQGKIVLVNQTAQAMLGITKDDVGKYLKDVVKDEHLLTVTKSISADTESVVEKDIEFVSNNESTKRVLRTSSAVVEDPNGNTVGMVTTLNDITRQKEVERLKGEFLANVSHELRTPLVAIEKSVSMMLDQSAGQVSDTQKQFLTIAERNLKRLTLLINDLLDLSKLEAQKMKISPALVNPSQVIDEAVNSLDSWAKTKSVSIEKVIADGLPLISIDPNRIIQVLINLIGNAIKFTPSAGKITVSCTQSIEQGIVTIRVQDTGVGIPQEDLSKIFDKFYQTRERPSSDICGTGIGLTIVKEIVELHGGKVWAESEHGKGAAFIFTLPLSAPGA
ncbi:MAG: cell wall metabolism sensor histidine kinase WalK [Candidatus Omnitrophica bacterium]|nr:cell wall metabolism sensor histidine kinase WalK [Candidatus Omnitrophota bacterium]